MAHCRQCGSTIKEGVKFCTECGASCEPAAEAAAPQSAAPAQTAAPQAAPVYNAPVHTPPSQAAPAYAAPIQPPAPDGKYELISTGGLIGIMLLMCIPILGQLLMIVWACGGCRKLQKRYLARASLILTLVGLLISLLLGFAFRSTWKRITSLNTVTSGKSFSVSDKDGTSELSQISELLKSLEALESLEALQNPGSKDTQTSALHRESGSTGDAPDAPANPAAFDSTASSDQSIGGLLDKVEALNQEAEKKADGWPDGLLPYPGGSAVSVASYRTEFTGTSQEEMLSYIDALKSQGYHFQDFYDFGMTEEDMLNMGGWWGTNGTLYLSISCFEGTVTIDHMTELPDLSSLLGD